MESLATTNGHAATMLPETVLEMVTASGDLGKLSTGQRAQYITALCQSMGLNALSRPIELISLNGKTVPYAKKDCTDQLRKLHRINIEIVGRETLEGVYTVTARATTPDGRTDEDVGSVTIANLKGDLLANATMKAHTKAKRRVTLSIVGLGILDESELETVKGARPVDDAPATPVAALSAHAEEAIEPDEAETAALKETADLWVARFDAATTQDQVKELQRECRAAVTDAGALLEITKSFQTAVKRIKGVA